MINKKVARYDRGSVRGDAVVTDEGYIRANAVVTRTGVFLYKNADGTIRRELRHPDDVWNEDSIATMELIPVTNGHPSEKIVTAENAKRLAIGYTGETIKKDGQFILANLVITDHEGVDWVMNQKRKELSLGYTVDLDEETGIYQGEQYDVRQRNIKYNHLAIVDRARAGQEARIALDGQDAEEIITEVEEMVKKKIKIDAEEVMVEPQTAEYIDRLHDDLKNLRDEKDRVEAEIKMIMDKLERAEGERDSLKDQVSSMGAREHQITMDSAEFKKAVNSRISLIKMAEENLDGEVLSKLDSMSDLEVKKAIIQKCRKTISLDGRSNIYLDAMYDTIVDDKISSKVNLDNVKYGEVKNDTGVSTEKARLNMMAKQQNASKGGK